ncbi:MAG: DUF3857 domain-containing protein [Chitinophagaceae bacterium]
MKSILFFLLASLPATIVAQSYNVLLIPDSLKKNANIIVRENSLEMEIKSPAKATVKERRVYTIMNEAGARYADYTTRYDNFFSINYIDAYLYDAMGKEIKHVKKKDMQDRSGVGEESLMDDARYKEYDFYYKTYPYTVAFEEEDDVNGLLYFNSWIPLFAPNMSVAFSKYVITAPKDYLIRYRPRNCSIQPVIKEDGNKKIYTWQLSNLTAITRESSAPDLNEIVPNVSFAPSVFEVDNYKGDMSTWEGFGKFIYQLLQNRDVLPDDIKTKVHQLAESYKRRAAKNLCAI